MSLISFKNVFIVFLLSWGSFYTYKYHSLKQGLRDREANQSLALESQSSSLSLRKYSLIKAFVESYYSTKSNAFEKYVTDELYKKIIPYHEKSRLALQKKGYERESDILSIKEKDGLIDIDVFIKDTKDKKIKDKFLLTIHATVEDDIENGMKLSQWVSSIGAQSPEDKLDEGEQLFLKEKSHTTLLIPCAMTSSKIVGNNGNLEKNVGSLSRVLTLFYKKISDKPLSLFIKCGDSHFSTKIIFSDSSFDVFKKISMNRFKRINRKQIEEKAYEKSLEKQLGVKIIE